MRCGASVAGLKVTAERSNVLTAACQQACKKYISARRHHTTTRHARSAHESGYGEWNRSTMQATAMPPDRVCAMSATRVVLQLRELPCVLTQLCELQLQELSLATDNCKEIFDRVYSATLHKGKPAARRGRKASGPNAHRRRIAGLPARGFSNASAVIPSVISLLAFFRTLVRTSRCDVRRCRTADPCSFVHWSGKGAIEKGKPVERRGRKASGLRDFILRQRGRQK